MCQSIPAGSSSLTDVQPSGEVLRIGEPGGHDNNIVAVDKAVIDEQGLEFPEEEPSLLGNTPDRINGGALDRIVKRAEVEPDQSWVADLRYRGGLLGIRRDGEESVVRSATSPPVRPSPPATPSSAGAGDQDFRPAGSSWRLPGSGDGRRSEPAALRTRSATRSEYRSSGPFQLRHRSVWAPPCALTREQSS